MTKPAIVCVDDDPEVLGAIERDLRQQYASGYRIVKARSGREALEAVRQLKQRGMAVALFLVDERMPEMSGTELLREVIKLFPEARRVLLTAYSDTQAAIAGINDLGLDYYLLKPWTPPGERLYPVLDDLLSDWTAHVRLPYDGIRVAGDRWSPRSYLVKDFLASNQVPYQWIDIDRDPSTRELIGSLGDSNRLPVVLFPDGTHLAAPTNRELAERIGLQTRARLPFYDLAVVGGGPAGLAAALYGASEGLRTVLVECHAPGGQAGTSSLIENYLGFPAGMSGADLARRASAQARRFGAELLAPEGRQPAPRGPLPDADALRRLGGLLLRRDPATGVSWRTLDVPGLEPLLGMGVYYGAAMTEAATYRGKEVCIVGGGNSAGQGALFFSRYARRVTLLVRGGTLAKSMSQYLIARITATPNIEVITRVEVEAVHGDGRPGRS